MIQGKRLSRGFTLIELLFVVGIISVLAAISVPNFLEAQTRAKIARVHTDMASMNTALNRYYVDQGAYPPNHPETTRYLEAAMLNPIMAEGYTTPPAKAEIPWYPEQMEMQQGANFEEFMKLNKIEDFGNPLKDADFPPLIVNSWQLHKLTTPVSYLGTHMPNSVFAPDKDAIFSYINSYELFTSTTNTTSTPGLWGDHLTSETFTMLSSEGPDGSFNYLHPLSGPWIGYDPTNGTASAGDFNVFQGRRPELVEPDESVIPKEEESGAHWGEFMFPMF